MSGPFGSSQWMYSSGGFYPTEIEQSLRFNDNDSAYLSRTFASTGNRKTWTFSAWVKRCNLGSPQAIFGARPSGTNPSFLLRFDSSDRIDTQWNTGASGGSVTTTSVYRDPSAWYHIVLEIDMTLASDRFKIYVNGEQITDFDSNTTPPQNTDLTVNASGYPHFIGLNNGFGQYPDYYLSEVNFIDGQALDPTSFGEFKSGVWVANSYTGTYGTNGFYLDFSDSANIGDDLSGSANDWTANNLVATDVVLDSPTNNFAVLNPLDDYANAREALSEGNLKATSTASNALSSSTILFPSSTKWYFEALQVSGTSTTANIFGVFGRAEYRDNSNSTASIVVDGSTVTTSISGFDAGDILGMALDTSTGDFEFFKNGSSIYSGTSSLGFVNQPANFYQSASGLTHIFNFGQDSSFAGNKTAQGNTDDNGVGDFYYSPPSGYLALCTANLPDPAIDPAQDDVPADYFNTVLYTGDGASTMNVSVGWQPDLFWVKSRGQAQAPFMVDAIRTGDRKLRTDRTDAEATGQGFSFTSTGWSRSFYDPETNTNGDGYVSWNWLAGNGTSSNTDGSITSTVSVNQKAGFSISAFTGNGTAGATVGHGLGAAPDVIIVKGRDTSGDRWMVYHSANTNNPETDYLILDGTEATQDNVNRWNDTAPTSSVFSLGDAGQVNRNADDFIAYCFAEVEGYSKFGSYTGNGSTDGPFVYCGFRPSLILTKKTSGTSNWQILDAARTPINDGGRELLRPNTSDAEISDGNEVDFLSNGFKQRSSDGSVNQSGGTYIYMAFAENPFKYANAR